MHLKFHGFDPRLGVTLTPGRRGQLRTSEGDRHYAVAINSHGLRGGEPASSRDLIGIVGDSFIFGYGVLERHLSAHRK